MSCHVRLAPSSIAPAKSRKCPTGPFWRAVLARRALHSAAIAAKHLQRNGSLKRLATEISYKVKFISVAESLSRQLFCNKYHLTEEIIILKSSALIWYGKGAGGMARAHCRLTELASAP